MRTMSAVEAKNAFGQLLEATHREPVAVTKNRRQIAAMFSMDDLWALARVFLAEPLLHEVETGKLDVVEAIMNQVQINQRLQQSRQAIADGQGVVADDTYFKNLRERAEARLSN